jgi:hypothetical protein
MTPAQMDRPGLGYLQPDSSSDNIVALIDCLDLEDWYGPREQANFEATHGFGGYHLIDRQSGLREIGG